MTRSALMCGITLGVAALGFLSVAGMAADSHDTSEDPRSDYTSAVSATTAFGMKIFRELAERDSNNILISPVGLGVALTMTYNGAAGETAREMAGLLELDALDPQEVNNAHAELIGKLPVSGDDLSLSMANSLWADLETPFREDFLATSEASYRAAIRNIDLGAPEAPDSINAWVGRETGERIGSVIQEIDPDVVLYLINAMYFRGRWAIPFDTSYTSPRVFTLADGSTRTVPLMMTELRQGHYYSGDGFMAARLDYGVGQASMYLFLPDEDSSLEEFCGRLNADNWTRWVSGFEIGPARILLPRLTLEYDGVLNGALRTLGMRRAFAGADFRRMTSERVFISMVKHSTRLEVDEAGTVAASAAVVELKKGPATVLAFTRPFFLAVVDNRTGAILFMGSVLEP